MNIFIPIAIGTAGQKLRKKVTDVVNGTVKMVDYLDGFQTEARGSRTPKQRRSHKISNSEQYAGEVLQFFPHPEGYVKATPANISLNSPPTSYSYNYVYNYTDHLGNVRMSFSKDPATSLLHILEENHYYPFGLKHEFYVSGGKHDYRRIPDTNDPKLIGVTQTDYQYKYNGKEFQDELGLNMYAMDMRQYDPAIARWVVMDPVVHHSMSPYNSFDNNPVFWADPSGADATDFVDRIWKAADLNGGKYSWQNTKSDTDKGEGTDDDITVDSKGMIVKVVPNDEPNRFYDEQGKELFFNDSDDLDAHLLTAKFKVGERLFYSLTSQEVMDHILSTGKISIYLGLQLRYALAAKKSHSEWDFAENYLVNFIEKPFYDNHSGRKQGNTTYVSESGYFRFGNTNYIYNLYDAGNYMWGRAMRTSNFFYKEAQFGSQFNESFNDSIADQNAIKRAYED